MSPPPPPHPFRKKNDDSTVPIKWIIKQFKRCWCLVLRNSKNIVSKGSTVIFRLLRVCLVFSNLIKFKTQTKSTYSYSFNFWCCLKLILVIITLLLFTITYYYLIWNQFNEIIQLLTRYEAKLWFLKTCINVAQNHFCRQVQQITCSFYTSQHVVFNTFYYRCKCNVK